ncbi:hypothetical protein RR11_207 [Ruegeria sp. R11]|nr:hypothetical protein RR11_207 [Ruegeria sp. R11]
MAAARPCLSSGPTLPCRFAVRAVPGLAGLNPVVGLERPRPSSFHKYSNPRLQPAQALP